MNKALLCASAMILFAACSDSDDNTPKKSDITLNFRMVDADSQDYKCGARGQNIAGRTDITTKDARLYIHDVALS